MKRSNFMCISLPFFIFFLFVGNSAVVQAAPPRGTGSNTSGGNQSAETQSTGGGKKNGGKKNGGKKNGGKKNGRGIDKKINDALAAQATVYKEQMDAYKALQSAHQKVTNLDQRIREARISRFVTMLDDKENGKLEEMPQRISQLNAMLPQATDELLSDVFDGTYNSLESDLKAIEERLLNFSREEFKVLTHEDFSPWWGLFRDLFGWFLTFVGFYVLFRRVSRLSSNSASLLEKVKKT